jgi:hypothetical protein
MRRTISSLRPFSRGWANPVRGRVIGVYNLLGVIGFPMGVYAGGWFGKWLGPAAAIACSGAATVLLGLVVMFLPVLRFVAEGEEKRQNRHKCP